MIDARQCGVDDPRVLAAYEQLVAAYGADIATEATSRFASDLADPAQALEPFFDALPDYYARQAVYRREMTAWKARWERERCGPPANPQVRERRQLAATAAGGVARGEANPRSRLTDEDVRSIRRRRAAGEKSADLAAEFGISKRMANLIISGERWAHVTH